MHMEVACNFLPLEMKSSMKLKVYVQDLVINFISTCDNFDPDQVPYYYFTMLPVCHFVHWNSIN